MGRPRPLQCSAWSFGPAFRSRDAAPCVLSARSRTPCEQGLFVTSRPGMLEGRARLLALATVAREPSLTCGSFFPRRALRTELRLRLLASYHTQARQFIEADVQAWILWAKASRLPHSSEKHPLRLSITATAIRCLTRLLICFPRRLGRSCPANETPRTHH